VPPAAPGIPPDGVEPGMPPAEGEPPAEPPPDGGVPAPPPELLAGGPLPAPPVLLTLELLHAAASQMLPARVPRSRTFAAAKRMPERPQENESDYMPARAATWLDREPGSSSTESDVFFERLRRPLVPRRQRRATGAGSGRPICLNREASNRGQRLQRVAPGSS